MPTSAEVASKYFDCVSRQDVGGMIDCWEPGGSARFVGMDELDVGRDYPGWFGNLFACFPDFRFEVIDIVGEEGKASVHWRATGTFDGEGTFEGFKPNGATIDIEGVDLLTVNGEGRITSIVALLNGLDMARQLGAVPPRGSLPDRAMAGAFNAKTALTRKLKNLRGRLVRGRGGSSRSRTG